MTTSGSLRDAIVSESQKSLDERMAVIRHCLDQVTDEQIWWRPRESINSIGNLILHLCGNVRQWIVAGIGETEDMCARQSEFDERGPIAKDELIRRLETAIAESKAILQGTDADQLLSMHRIQGFDVTGIGAIYSSIPHFSGHTQEIILLTRMQLGQDYKFNWQPKTRAEGAPE